MLKILPCRVYSEDSKFSVRVKEQGKIKWQSREMKLVHSHNWLMLLRSYVNTHTLMVLPICVSELPFDCTFGNSGKPLQQEIS
jgi:hypothetical protein